jgi:hypothetical protein
MGRIRTIKPEFPQSESVGAISRDARLLFIQLWTIGDDEGEGSRRLASILYPYDDDAPALIEGWLDELERNEMVRRYVVDGSTYLEIVNWLEHQKIDRPSKSRLPAFDDGSRVLVKPREASSADLGPWTRTVPKLSLRALKRPAIFERNCSTGVQKPFGGLPARVRTPADRSPASALPLLAMTL